MCTILRPLGVKEMQFSSIKFKVLIQLRIRSIYMNIHETIKPKEVINEILKLQCKYIHITLYHSKIYIVFKIYIIIHKNVPFVIFRLYKRSIRKKNDGTDCFKEAIITKTAYIIKSLE